MFKMGCCTSSLNHSFIKKNKNELLNRSVPKNCTQANMTIKSNLALNNNNYQFLSNTNLQNTIIDSNRIKNFITSTQNYKTFSNEPSQLFYTPKPPTNSIQNYDQINRYKTPKRFIALYDYHARTVEDLSFRKGDILLIIDDTQGAWWLAQNLSEWNPDVKFKGFVPSNYITPYNNHQSQPWFHSTMTRSEAERALMSTGNHHGSFLVRESETSSGDFSLSVRVEDKVKHFMIEQSEKGFCINKSYFPSLYDLICYYQHHSNMALIQPCKMQEWSTEEWEIPKSYLKLMDKIGQGHFGDVYEAMLPDGTMVAVKTLRPGSMNAQDFLEEAHTLKNLRHPNLIRLHAVCTRSEPMFIVTELMSQGSLLECLRSQGPFLKLCALMQMCVQVCRGMVYLEAQNYVHRDLAARNVLVGEGGAVKIADFGLARLLFHNTYEAKAGARIPIKWTAPEAANFNRFSTKSDVWSFGVLLSEVVTLGKVPYPDMTNNQVLVEVQNGYRMPRPQSCPEALYVLMLLCWAAQACNRPTFACVEESLQKIYQESLNLDVFCSSTVLIR